MTEADRYRAEGILMAIECNMPDRAKELIQAYQAEHERMRQFIRNLADESRVYLESEE